MDYGEIQKAILKEARKIYSPKVIELSQYPGNLGVIEKANGFGIIKGICGERYIHLGVGDSFIIQEPAGNEQ